MLNHFKLPAFAVVATAFFLSSGCNPQPPHPNQLNAFDGAAYDSLTLAHGALASLRMQVSKSYPMYSPVFNEAATAYSAAYDAYSLYRTNPSDQSKVSAVIRDLALSIVALESAFESDLHVSPKIILKLQRRSLTIRKTAGPNASVADILTALEIAAAIAQSVPLTQPYSGLAVIVIDATQHALAAEQAASGQPIDLLTIQPVSLID